MTMRVTDGLNLAAPAPAKKTIGQQFEQQFMELMLKEMQRATPGLFGEGEVSETFGDEMMRGLADKLVDAGGFGLGANIDKQLAGLPMQAPLEHMKVSSPFGERISPITKERVEHHGLDLAAPEGAPIRPVRPGIVRQAAELEGFGLTVVVDHGNGTQSLYAHCSELNVQPGDAVGYADVIARVGSTGRSTGPHLHLEIEQDGERIDPGTFF